MNDLLKYAIGGAIVYFWLTHTASGRNYYTNEQNSQAGGGASPSSISASVNNLLDEAGYPVSSSSSCGA
jgi:hypothetical protein